MFHPVNHSWGSTTTTREPRLNKNDTITNLIKLDLQRGWPDNSTTHTKNTTNDSSSHVTELPWSLLAGEVVCPCYYDNGGATEIGTYAPTSPLPHLSLTRTSTNLSQWHSIVLCLSSHCDLSLVTCHNSFRRLNILPIYKCITFFFTNLTPGLSICDSFLAVQQYVIFFKGD